MIRTLLLLLAIPCALAATDDLDGDGFTGDDDCDDSRDDVHPGAPEICNLRDDDCDGAVDEEPLDAVVSYRDGDGDGYGTADEILLACEPPVGWAIEGGDCDDADLGVHPAAVEVCNGRDDDCDGLTDDLDPGLDPATTVQWYADGDGDGIGALGATTAACDPPPGFVGATGDCDDDDPSAWPGAVEICDGVDDDCDGSIDEGAVDITTWYADADADGFGDLADAWIGCGPPAGRVADATDCDDGAAGIHPGAVERCDGVDEDCDGAVDEGAVDGATWWRDRDGDGYGDPDDAGLACALPPGHVANPDDCDDRAPGAYPGGVETCDGVDEDCDGAVDEGAIGATWYRDADGDGLGDPDAPVQACGAPPGHVAAATDCDDGDPAVGIAPFGAWYVDADGDGYGAGAAQMGCPADAGIAYVDGDCDDTEATVHPGAVEHCDGLDNDCLDGEIGAASFVDADGAWTDYGAALEPGGNGVTLAVPGTLYLCEGDFEGPIRITAPGDVAIVGDGEDFTTLDMRSTGLVDEGNDGGPLPQAHTLTVSGLTIVGALGSHGAITSRYGSLVVADSVVEAPVATDSSAVGAWYGDTRIERSTIRDSLSPYGAVGGPYTSLTVVDSTIVNAEAYGILGGDDAFGGGGVTVTGTTVDTVYLGTGVYLATGLSTLDGVTILGAETGVDLAPGATATVTGSTISSPGVTGLGVGASVRRATLTLDTTDLFGEDNGLYVDHGTVSVVDSSFTGFTDRAIRAVRSDVTVSGSRFDDNGAYGNFGHDDGGAIWAWDSALHVAGSSFDRNTADEYGGAIWASGEVTVEATSFDGNTADAAGAVYVTDGEVVSFDGVTATANEAYSGGAVYIVADTFVEHASWYDGNVATNGPGGALFVVGTDVVSTASTYTANTASQEGGAIHLVTGGSWSFTDVWIEGNQATGVGGGIGTEYDFNLASGRLDLVRPTITGNVSGADGGGVYATEQLEEVTCVGEVGVPYGFYSNVANRGGGLFLAFDLNGQPLFTSTDCDFGLAASANVPGDIGTLSGKNFRMLGDDVDLVCFNDKCTN